MQANREAGGGIEKAREKTRERERDRERREKAKRANSLVAGKAVLLPKGKHDSNF